MTTSKSVSSPDVEKRRPTRFINYAGDVVAGFNSLEPMGPNTIGEFMWPVTSEYDADADQTRVGLSYIAPGHAPTEIPS